MGLVVRSASLETDREQIIETIRQFQTSAYNDRRFDWLYRENPHGKARAWVAQDSGRDNIIGLAAAFPRRLYVKGALKGGAVLGDFWMDPHYRALGPALQLQRACLTIVDRDPTELCYDFPSTQMLAIYQRLGIKPYGRTVRYAKPLRADRKISAKVKVPALARGLSGIANSILAAWSHKADTVPGITIALESGRFSEEFSTLAKQLKGQPGICIERSAEYLNWRYVHNPLNKYEVLTARRQGGLVAYLVFARDGDDARIVDVFGEFDYNVLPSLIAHVVVLLRDRGVITVSAPLIEGHPLSSIVEGLGFRARESSPVMVYLRRSAGGFENVTQERWFLTHGDRES